MGLDDPRQLNDRFVLGMQGSMAEYELGLWRQRAREAFEQKIRRGHVMWECRWALCARKNRLEKIADRQVQQALDGVFQVSRTRECPADHAVVPRCAAAVARGPPWDGGPRHPMATAPWASYSPDADQSMLLEPRLWAHRAQTVIEDGRARQSTRRKSHWSSGASCCWSSILATSAGTCFSRTNNLEANRAMPAEAAGGAAKRGPALLSGLLRCGRCGRKLQVVYRGTTGRVPRDVCRGGRVDRGSSSCLTVGGLRVDPATAAVLEALQPAGSRRRSSRSIVSRRPMTRNGRP